MTHDVGKMIAAAKELERLLALESCHHKSCVCNFCEARGELRYQVRWYEVEQEDLQKSLARTFSTADPGFVKLDSQESK